MKIKIGTRASNLAMTQTIMVKDALEEKNPGLVCEIVTINTKGDIDLKSPIHKVGKGVFVREIEDALLKGEIDLAVHSMKDMPSELTPGLMFFDPPKSSDPRDVLVMDKKINSIDELKPGIIATGSLRRSLQIKSLRSDIETVGIRGNIETRMSKVGSDNIMAVMLAYAGLLRAGYEDRVSYVFSIDEVIPSPCQGILAIQGRADDDFVRSLVLSIRDEDTSKRMKIEREFQCVLDAGCHSPMGFYAELNGDKAILRGVFGDNARNLIIKKKRIVDYKEAVDAAAEMAMELKSEVEQ